jgi:hypothetical protein
MISHTNETDFFTYGQNGFTAQGSQLNGLEPADWRRFQPQLFMEGRRTLSLHKKDGIQWIRSSSSTGCST